MLKKLNWYWKVNASTIKFHISVFIDVVSNNYTVNAWKLLTTHAVESGVTTFCKQTYSQVQLVLYINNSSRDYSRLVLVIGEIGWRFHWFAFYFSFSTTSIQHRCNPKLDIWHSRQKTKLNYYFNQLHWFNIHANEKIKTNYSQLLVTSQE